MDIKCLLKFGEREKISGIQTGKVWMSTPEALRPLEHDLVRGQGDKLEGGMHINSSKMQLTNPTTGFSVTQTGDFNFDILMDPVNKVPIYCMFAVYDSEVESGEIKLGIETQTVIRDHFPKADSVAVIKKPYDFIREFEASIHDDNENTVILCRSGKVNYFFVTNFMFDIGNLNWYTIFRLTEEEHFILMRVLFRINRLSTEIYYLYGNAVSMENDVMHVVIGVAAHPGKLYGCHFKRT